MTRHAAPPAHRRPRPVTALAAAAAATAAAAAALAVAPDVRSTAERNHPWPTATAGATGPDSHKPTAPPAMSTSAPSKDSTATDAPASASTPQESPRGPVGAFSGAPPAPSGTPGSSTPTESTPRPGNAQPPPETPPDPLTDLINDARADAGCPPVTADPGLTGHAQAWSTQQATDGTMHHSAGPDGWPAWAENVAAGYPDPTSVVAAWMTSDDHRAAILTCTYTHAGTGHADGPGGPYWTLVLGAQP